MVPVEMITPPLKLKLLKAGRRICHLYKNISDCIWIHQQRYLLLQARLHQKNSYIGQM